MTPMLLVVTDQLGAHLRAALSAHALRCRRDGISVPPELAALLLSLAASSGPDGPGLVDGAPDPHAVSVSYYVAAKRLGVSARTVRRMASDGRLHVVRAGRRVLVPVAALDAYTGRRAA